MIVFNIYFQGDVIAATETVTPAMKYPNVNYRIYYDTYQDDTPKYDVMLLLCYFML